MWPDTHVTPSVLTGCIRELRRALGDDARAARFIETAYRRGYRFIAAPVCRSVPVAAVAPPAAERDFVPTGDLELAELARRFARAVVHVIERGRRERIAGAETSRPAVRRGR